VSRCWHGHYVSSRQPEKLFAAVESFFRIRARNRDGHFSTGMIRTCLGRWCDRRGATVVPPDRTHSRTASRRLPERHADVDVIRSPETSSAAFAIRDAVTGRDDEPSARQPMPQKRSRHRSAAAVQAACALERVGPKAWMPPDDADGRCVEASSAKSMCAPLLCCS